MPYSTVRGVGGGSRARPRLTRHLELGAPKEWRKNGLYLVSLIRSMILGWLGEWLQRKNGGPPTDWLLGPGIGCNPTDLRPLVARALEEARQHGEARAAQLLELSLLGCFGAAHDPSDGRFAVTAADPSEENGYEGAEAVTGWSVFWAVWLTILCLFTVLLAVAGSPRLIRRHVQTSLSWLPLAGLAATAFLWRLYIYPPLEHVLAPSLEKMIQRARTFNVTINVSADKAEFIRSENAWLAEMNSLNRGFRLEIDDMMHSPSAPQPTLMLLFFSLTAAATYSVVVARVVQDVLPASASTWLEPAPVGWLIAIPASWFVGWQGCVGYRVVSSALRLAVVMRGHVTALHRLGEELVAASNAEDTNNPALPWREASADLKGIVERLEGRRWGIKLAGFHMDKQFEATFTSTFLKIMIVAVGVVLPLVWSKTQIQKRDRKMAEKLRKHKEHVRRIKERYEGLVLADELDAAELTDFKSSHILDGGQATLFEATYKDETVAVKCTHQDFSLDTYERELSNRQKGSSGGSAVADDTDVVPPAVLDDPARTPHEAVPPTSPDKQASVSEAPVFSGEAIGLAVCHHPNVLSYRGRVDPDKLKTNTEFRAAFRKYKGKIPDEDSINSNSSSTGPGITKSDAEDVAAMRIASRLGQFQRQYRDWYFSTVLITPYCVGRSLHDALHSEGPYAVGGSGGRIGEVRLLVAARSIAKGMKYIHERNLVHNDLKPKNILLDSVHWGLPPRPRTSDGYSQPSDPDPDWCCQHVKIGDFGLCEIGGGLGSGSSEKRDRENPVGTDPYMAPEMIASPETLDEDNQKQNCDIYSFGMLLLTMVGRKEPWEEQLKRPGVEYVRRWVVEQENVKKRTRGERETMHAEMGRPPIPRYVDDGYRALIRKCWNHDPDQRPRFEQVFSELRSTKTMVVLARPDLSGLLWEIKPFSRRKKNGATQPDADENHETGVEALSTHGISTFEALHEAVHGVGVERRRLATSRQAQISDVDEGVRPACTLPALAKLKQSQLQKIEDWVNRWQHHH